MDGKINKKTIAIIAVIAILLVAAISLTAVFLNDQGETEATVGDTSASNGSEEQNAQDQRSSEENNNEEEQQPAEESEEATDDNEETEVARTDNNADVDADNDNDNNDNDNDADTTTATDDSQTVLVDEEVQTATELVNAGWNNTEIGLSQLANVEALNPELTSKLEVSTTKIENQNVEVEYKITISNSSDIDAKQIMVSMDIPEGVEFVSAENANYHEELGKVIWVIDVNANNSTELTLKVKNTIYRGEFTAVAVVDGAETNEVTTTVDDTEAPKITLYPSTNPEGKRTIGKDGEYSEISFAFEDNWMLKEYEINDTLVKMTPDKWSNANYMNIKDFLVEGENIIILRDMAGNETKFTFIYDITAPKYKYLGIARNTSKEDKRNQQYAKVGDSVRVLVAFTEKLDIIPTVKMFGKEYEATYRPQSSNPSSNTYYYMADIKMTDDMPEGEIPFEIYGYADKAGNVGLNLANADINLKEYPRVILDKTNPELIIKGNEGKEGCITVGKDGEYSQISFKLFDNIALDKIEINGNLIDKPAVQWNDANYMNIKQYLKEGENIVVLTDMAGNETELTFIYDVTAPEHTNLGIFNRSHWEEGNMKVATTGDLIRLFVAFPEMLDVEPTATIFGEDGRETKIQLTYDSKAKWYSKDFRITDDMNLPEGEIKFEISGYTDKAGNVGETLNNDSDMNEKYPEVVYDVTAPEAIKVQLWDKEDGETETIRNGQTVRVMVTFDEKLETLPTLTIGNLTTTMKPTSDGKDGTIYQADIKIAEDEETIPEGRLPFTISGYTDEAGNVGADITEESENVTGIIYDRTNPKLTIKGNEGEEGAITVGNDGEYSQISFKLFDNYALGEIEINGKIIEKPAVQWNDANYMNIKQYLKEGKNTVILRDLAGNKDELTFIYDTTKPTITVKEGEKYTIGSDGEYSKISLKFHDNNTLKEYVINGTVVGLAKDSWGDANYTGKLDSQLKEGENTVILRDMAGNKDTLTFIYDITSPEAKVTFSNNNGNAMTNKDVTVTLKANESIKNIEGWTRVDDKTFIKEYSENGKYSVEIEDKAGNKATIKFEVKRIDKVAPEAKVTFSNNNGNAMTNEDVTATLTANESIKNIEGWTRVDDKTFTKVYSENGKYSVEIEDKAGNKATIKFEVKRIDKVAPEAKVTFSNNNGNAMTNEDVTVTLKANESIKNIEGWTRVDDKTFTKVYSENGKYSVEIEDKAGNKATIKFEVKRIDRVDPEAKVIFSNNNGNALTNKDVTVTLKANESIKNIEGWTRVDDKTFTKEYSENGKYSVEIEDKAGNKVTIKFEVKRIDKVAPTIELNGERKIYLKKGEKYDEQGAVMHDNIDDDKEISKPSRIDFYGENGEKEFSIDSINTDRVGQYNLIYTCTDKAGNYYETIRKIFIEE